MDPIEKKAEDARANKIESLKFEMKEKSEKISEKFETISEPESEIEELKNRSLRKTLILKNIKYH